MSCAATPMSGVDTAWLRMESPANPMMIGAVLVFDRPIPQSALRQLLEERFLSFRRFRQRVIKEDDQHCWEDDPYFDLDNHLHVVGLPGKGSQDDLQQFVSDLNSTPLNSNHPLWQIHYVDNYQGGCALVVRIHHCIADGISLVRVLLSLTDDAAHGNVRPLHGFNRQTPEQLPEWRKILHRLRRNANLARDMAEDFRRQLQEDPWHPLKLAREGVNIVRDLGQVALSKPDPASALKGRLTGRKRVAWAQPLDLDEVKRTAHAFGGTVNDILLCAATGAVHEFLERSEGAIPAEEIHVAVPFNLRPLDQPITQLGNQFGLCLVPLPVTTHCPRERFAQVRSGMQALKQSYQAQVTYGLLDVMGRGPDLLERRAIEILSRKASAVMTNVPGPQDALYLCGARLTQPMFWVPQTGEVGVGLSIFSYNGEVQFGVISDKQLIQDPETVTGAFVSAFEELRHLALGPREVVTTQAQDNQSG